MKIIIAGAGEIGFHLSKQLSNEAHDITVIDINQLPLDRIDAAVEVLTINGSSTSISVLKEAQIENTDLVLAVTSSEAININTAIIAKKLGAVRTVARVANAEYVSADYTDMFKSLGIDHIVYPEELAAFEIVKLVQRSAATDVLEFEDGKLSLLGLKLDQKAPVVRKSMKVLSEEYSGFNFRIVAIQRGIRTIIPTGDDILLPNDQIFVISPKNKLDDIIRLTGKSEVKIENMMILGGGKIGRKAARLLEKSVNIKIIESNKDKTLNLADYLENTLVIQGDGRDLDLLAQESIIDMDSFIALTNDAETNIISSLMAKHLGVEKTITQVDKADYVPLTQTIGLDSLINKKLIAANNIMRFIRKADVISVATLQGIDAEVFEFVAKPGSTVTKNPVKKLKFPKNAIIGGYIRDGEGTITVGDSQILPGDKVVIFALPGAVNKVEKFFH
ncbi:MAG: Trk system potassium transporter TrkA [Rhodothermaceae bacterium]